MILVTGGTGLVGAQLIYDLLQAGRRVRAMRRQSSSMLILRRIFFTRPELLDGIEWVEGDVTDPFAVREALEGVSEVYHSAGMISFQPSDFREMMRINSQGTANMVNMSLETGVKRFCHISSIAALGRLEENTLITEDSVWKTSGSNSNYAISKYSAEREVWRGTEEGLPAIIVNPGVITGPGDWNKGSSKLFRQVWNGLSFYTEGMTGFVDVRDVSSCCIQLMEKNLTGKRFILVSENLTYREVLNHIAMGFQRKAPVYKARAWMSELIWRLEAARSILTGSKPLITKETSRNSRKNWQYSNKRIKDTLHHDCIPIEKSVRDACEIYLREL